MGPYLAQHTRCAYHERNGQCRERHAVSAERWRFPSQADTTGDVQSAVSAVALDNLAAHRRCTEPKPSKRNILAVAVADQSARFEPIGANFGLNAGYAEATGSHISASMRALAEVASLVSTQSTEDAYGQHVRLSLFDHGSCLNQLLFGFAVRLSLGRTVTPPPAPLLPPPQAEHLVQGPAATAEIPLLYAVVANHPVEVQIQHTISFLARLVARRTMTQAVASGSLPQIDSVGSQVDAEADREVTDLLRAEGWKSAAIAVRVRAEASGRPLVVRSGGALMTPDQIRLQIPIVRRVYNESAQARHAIDILATLMSQGMMMVGGGSAEIAGFVRDQLDLGLNRTYLAHLVRDAYVCGNGYLAYGPVPDEDMRLLLPEAVTIREDGSFEEATPTGLVVHSPEHVMHVKGATQAHSQYGVSLLEPLVSVQAHREIAEGILARAAAWDNDAVPEESRKHALEMRPLGERIAAMAERDTEAILGPTLATNSLRIQVPDPLYFRGFEELRPAARGIAISEPLPPQK